MAAHNDSDGPSGNARGRENLKRVGSVRSSRRRVARGKKRISVAGLATGAGEPGSMVLFIKEAPSLLLSTAGVAAVGQCFRVLSA